jgi:hypothetical protein
LKRKSRLAERSILFLFCCCAAGHPSLAGQAAPTAKITGIVTDFKNSPIPGAEVIIKNKKFEDVAVASTDARGAFELTVGKGRYMALYACKDYSVNNLEFWSWNLIVDKDLVINPRIDGLEVYALNAFMVPVWPPTMQLYFRPMSLKRVKKDGGVKKLKEDEKMKDGAFFDIAPRLTPPDIDAEVNGERVQILELNRGKEYNSKPQDAKAQEIWSYLMQTSLPKDQDGKIWHICVTLKDTDTKEQGEGCLSWERPNYVEKGEGS